MTIESLLATHTYLSFSSTHSTTHSSTHPQDVLALASLQVGRMLVVAGDVAVGVAAAATPAEAGIAEPTVAPAHTQRAQLELVAAAAAVDSACVAVHALFVRPGCVHVPPQVAAVAL